MPHFFAILMISMFRLKRFNAIFYGFTTLVVMNFIFGISNISIAVVNSSFLAQFFSPETVSVIFSVGALVMTMLLIGAPTIASLVSPRALIVVIIPVLQVSIILLGFSQNGIQATTFFIIQGALFFTLLYLLDLFVKGINQNGTQTGSLRGIFITGLNFAAFLAVMLPGVFIINNFYPPLYAFSALALAPAFFLAMTKLRHVVPKIPAPATFFHTIKYLWCCNHSVAYVVAASFLLYLFLGWSGLYIPLLLVQEGGFSWQVVSGVLVFVLIPFLLLEIPAGWLADKFFGETEMMGVGFALAALGFVGIAFIPLWNIVLWATALFVARSGAALVQAMSESYFFKHVNIDDATLMSVFRITRPLAFIVAPLIALLFLPVTGLQTVFAVFATILLIGVPLSLRIWDTK